MSFESIREAFFATGDARAVLAQRTGEIETTVIEAYREALAGAFPSGLAVLAVGGFGRRELFPYSDVDVLLLVDKEPPDREGRDALSLFLRRLWDSGMRLSHSVHTPQECCEIHDSNPELNVSLLDQRFLAGDEDLYERLVITLPRFLAAERQTLARHLCRMARGRYLKAHNTIYHLEPNIKEGPGGLRDLHLIGWLEKLRMTNMPATAAPEVDAALAAACDFLFPVRCFLHYCAARDSNLLNFEAQEEITEQAFTETREPAAWMREYFRNAREVFRAAGRAIDAAEETGGSLLASFRDWRSRLSNAEFTVSRERVYLRVPGLFEREPEMALRLFQFVARHGFRLSLEAERRIADFLPGLRAYFAQSRPIWAALDELLSLPHAALALRAMHETAVLTAIFPEWEHIESLVVRDFYHRYTVDEHTLIAIESLCELRSSSDPLLVRFVELMSEIDTAGLLFFTILFHDSGKGGGEGRHVIESRILADGAMERIAMPHDKRRVVRLLIDRHLELSALMTGRDLEDPATASLLAEQVQTLENLKLLTLLTYADISAVNPEAMTPWRLAQLWAAYLAGYKSLTRELDSQRIDVPQPAIPQDAEFLVGFPKRYARMHSAEQVEEHLKLAARAREAGVAVELKRDNGTHEAAIVARDRPGLFASFAGALSSFGLNILKAEAFANRRGDILDTFAFSDPSRTLELNPSEVDRLRMTLERVARGKVDVRRLLQSRPKSSAPTHRSRIQPAAGFDSEASAASTLIEIVAQDRPGLLYDLTRTLSEAGCNIEVVLIDTQAHKAIDVFYVTHSGKKLGEELQQALRTKLLEVCRV